MPASTLTLSPESVATIASAAIFDHLSGEARENLIKQAIEHLLTPEKDRQRYSYGKTPLQTAFEQAIAIAAQKAVTEAVANDEAVLQRIRDILGPMINPLLDAQANEFDSTLADAIGTAIASALVDQARKSR